MEEGEANSPTTEVDLKGSDMLKDDESNQSSSCDDNEASKNESTENGTAVKSELCSDAENEPPINESFSDGENEDPKNESAETDTAIKMEICSDAEKEQPVDESENPSVNNESEIKSEENPRNDEEIPANDEKSDNDGPIPEKSPEVQTPSVNTSVSSRVKTETVQPIEGELDFEEEIPEKEEAAEPEDGKIEDSDGEKDGEIKKKTKVKKKKKSDEDKEEGEEDSSSESSADDGEVTDDDDLEEGEVKDAATPRKSNPRPLCRFFAKGNCTWGSICRFIHPGINDKGNYNMFAPKHPLGPGGNVIPPPPFPFQSGPRMAFSSAPPVYPPPPFEEVPPAESAWERGLRHAKELMKKALRRKEEPDFEEKRLNMSLDGERIPDYEKENDYYVRESYEEVHNNPYRRDMSPDDERFEPGPYNKGYHHNRGGRYENFEVRTARNEYDFKNKRPNFQKQFPGSSNFYLSLIIEITLSLTGT